MPLDKGVHDNPKHRERRRQEIRMLTPKQRIETDKLQVFFRGQKWEKADQLWESFKQNFVEARKPIPIHAIIPMIGCYSRTGRTEEMISLFKLLRKQVESAIFLFLISSFLKKRVLRVKNYD